MKINRLLELALLFTGGCIAGGLVTAVWILTYRAFTGG
jgi:hypothetical protein